MELLTLILVLPLLALLGWAVAAWVRADAFHPRPQPREWFD